MNSSPLIVPISTTQRAHFTKPPNPVSLSNSIILTHSLSLQVKPIQFPIFESTLSLSFSLNHGAILDLPTASSASHRRPVPGRHQRPPPGAHCGAAVKSPALRRGKRSNFSRENKEFGSFCVLKPN